MLKVKEYKKPLFYLIFSAFCLWHFHLTYQIPLPQEGGIFFYSNESCSLERLAIKWISQAKESIDIECYMITDRKWINQLVSKAKEGVKINIYHHCNHPKLFKNLHPNIIASPSKRKSLMHKKLIMVDKQLCLIGSSNLTQASLLMHDNIMIGINSKEFGKGIQSHRDYFSHESIQLFNLPASASLFVKKILEEIEKAQKHIVICMFCLSEKRILSALTEAAKRGVRVDLIIDTHTYQCPMEEKYFHIKKTRNKNLMHHKFGLFDDGCIIFGSANWTKNGLSKNEEYGVVIDHPAKELMREFRKTVKKINRY